MHWNKDRSAALSQMCVALFALCLLALDIGAYWIARWFVDNRFVRWQSGILLTGSIYAGSIFGWFCLCALWRLLGNIRRGEVFVSANVRLLRLVSWCCVWVAAVCLLSAIYYLPFAFIAVAAGFMALVVRIVKNAF